jgi:hypothetical protein
MVFNLTRTIVYGSLSNLMSAICCHYLHCLLLQTRWWVAAWRLANLHIVDIVVYSHITPTLLRPHNKTCRIMTQMELSNLTERHDECLSYNAGAVVGGV